MKLRGFRARPFKQLTFGKGFRARDGTTAQLRKRQKDTRTLGEIDVPTSRIDMARLARLAGCVDDDLS